MGSLNKFGWLATVNVTSRWKATESRYEIPLRLAARDFSSLFARKNFDFAQDDIQRVYGQNLFVTICPFVHNRFIFSFCESAFLKGVRGKLFSCEKSFPRILSKLLYKTKKRIWFTNPLFSLGSC